MEQNESDGIISVRGMTVTDTRAESLDENNRLTTALLERDGERRWLVRIHRINRDEEPTGDIDWVEVGVWIGKSIASSILTSLVGSLLDGIFGKPKVNVEKLLTKLLEDFAAATKEIVEENELRKLSASVKTLEREYREYLNSPHTRKSWLLKGSHDALVISDQLVSLGRKGLPSLMITAGIRMGLMADELYFNLQEQAEIEGDKRSMTQWITDCDEEARRLIDSWETFTDSRVRNPRVISWRIPHNPEGKGQGFWWKSVAAYDVDGVVTHCSTETTHWVGAVPPQLQTIATEKSLGKRRELRQRLFDELTGPVLLTLNEWQQIAQRLKGDTP